MPLGMEVGLGPGDIVLDLDPTPPKKGHSTPNFSAHVYCGQRWPISATAEYLYRWLSDIDIIIIIIYSLQSCTNVVNE